MFPILRLIIQLQSSRQYGIGRGINSTDQRMEPRTQKQTHKYAQLILDKMQKQFGKEIEPFNKLFWNNWTSISRINMNHLIITTDMKIIFTWRTDLNIKQKTIELLEKNGRKSSESTVAEFLDLT